MQGFSRESLHSRYLVIEELSALLPKKQLYRLYEQTTREPYSFLFVYYLKPKNEMFYKRFEERLSTRSVRTSPAALPSQPSSRPSSAGWVVS